MGRTNTRQAPDAEAGEDEDTYLERCTEELTGEGFDDDEAAEVCQIAWEERSARGLVRKTHAEPVQGMEFVLSDESVDRMGDIITADGWDLAAFRKNPIALFSHRADFPIGKWNNVRVESKKLKGQLVLAPEGTSERIDEIRRLVNAGILCAVSVGFQSIEREPIDKEEPWGAQRFLRQELLETSVVSVPANANALAVAKSLNISSSTIDLVFAGQGRRGAIRRRGLTGGQATSSQVNGRKGTGAMSSLSQKITALQADIVSHRDQLQAHLDGMDNSNVSDRELEVTRDLNAKIEQRVKLLTQLEASERNLASTAGSQVANSGSREIVQHNPEDAERARRRQYFQATSGSKDLKPLDYLVRAGVVTCLSRVFNRSPDEICRGYAPYNDEKTRAIVEWNMRGATTPAMTTVAGWAAELVTQIQGDYVSLLMPKSIFPRLSAAGLALSFGAAGRIAIPTHNATPTISGSFVGEGMPIPVRLGQFASQILVPKKLAVITTFTREISEHSIPAIEPLLRDAIGEDTAVAIDSILIDKNPATVIRPAGIFNNVTPIAATAGGGLAALVGDLKNLLNALTTGTRGNLRNPVWLMNPGAVNNAKLTGAANTGIFPFRDELGEGMLLDLPVIDSGTVPVTSVGIIDASDFVTAGADGPRFDISDQATIHEEDTTPLPIVSGAAPGTPANPVRSLWQTDTIGLRMIQRLNWVVRRANVVALVESVTW